MDKFSHFTQLKGIKKVGVESVKGLLWGLFNSVSITWIPGWFKGAFTSPATEVTTEWSCKPGLQSQVYYSWHSRRVGSFSFFSSGFKEFHLFFPQRLSGCWESNFGQENIAELNKHVWAFSCQKEERHASESKGYIS